MDVIRKPLTVILIIVVAFTAGFLYAQNLQPSLTIQNIGGENVPYQNNIPLGSFQRQSSRSYLSLNGTWVKERVTLNHNTTMDDRGAAGIAAIESEANNRHTTGYNDSGWASFDLPQQEDAMCTYENATGPEDYDNGVWYRRHFNPNASWSNSAVKLYIMRANYVVDVWINGSYVGYHEGGFAPFSFDVSSYLNYGQDNVVAIRVDRIPMTFYNGGEIVPYDQPDFNMYTGILGDVFLEASEKVKIIRCDVIPQNVSGDLNIKAVVDNNFPSDVDVDIEYNIYEAGINAGNELSLYHNDLAGALAVGPLTHSAQTVPASSVLVDNFPLNIPNPNLWEPAIPGSYADLYILRITVRTNGVVLDDYYDQFGIRTLDVSGDKILLNGDFAPLFRGVARHEEIHRNVATDGGPVLTDTETWNDLTQIRDEMYANLIRTGHYMSKMSAYVYADRLGIAMYSEIPVVGFDGPAFNYQRNTRKAAKQMWREMNFSLYNNPSLCFMGALNEGDWDNERQSFIQDLHDDHDAIDGTRLVSQAAVGADDTDGTHSAADIVGVNMYHGVFVPPYNADEYWDTIAGIQNLHAAHNKPILVTEFGIWSQGGGSSEERQRELFTNTFNALITESYWKEDLTFDANGCVAGMVWWTMYNWFSPNTGVQSMGLYHMDRTTPKLAKYSVATKYSQFIVPNTNEPSVPGNVAAFANHDSQMIVRWNRVAFVTNYAVYRALSNDTNSAVKILHVDVSENLVIDTAAAVGTTYYYWIKAVNEFGESAFSAPAWNSISPSIDTNVMWWIREGGSVNGAWEYSSTGWAGSSTLGSTNGDLLVSLAEFNNGSSSVQYTVDHVSGTGNWVWALVGCSADGLGNPPGGWEEYEYGKDITFADMLEFYIRGAGPAAVKQIGIELEDTRGWKSDNLYLADYVTADGTWQLVQIPLYEFSFGGGVDLQNIRNLSLSLGELDPTGAYTVYIDDMRFYDSGLTNKYQYKILYEDNWDNPEWDFSYGWQGNGSTIELTVLNSGVPVSTTEKYKGYNSVMIHFTHVAAGWAGCALSCDEWGRGHQPSSWGEVDSGPIDLRGTDILDFWVKGDAGSESIIEFEDIYGAVNTKRVLLSSYVTVNGTWQNARIPMQDFGLSLMDTENVKYVKFMTDESVGAGEWIFYVDNMRAISKTGVPFNPVDLKGYGLSTNEIELTWTDLGNETSYTVYRALADDTNSAAAVAGTSADTVVFRDTSVSFGNTYYYWVKAYNEYGSSGFSSSVAVEPGAFEFYWILYDHTSSDGVWDHSGGMDGGAATTYGGSPNEVTISTTEFYSGNTSLALEFTHGGQTANDWAWVYIPTTADGSGHPPLSGPDRDAPKDVSHADVFEFMVKSSGSGALDAIIELGDTAASKSARVYLSDYVAPTSDWQKVQIPLSDFGYSTGLDYSILKQLEFSLNENFPTGTFTLYLDDVKFVSADLERRTNFKVFFEDMSASDGHWNYGWSGAGGSTTMEQVSGSVPTETSIVYAGNTSHRWNFSHPDGTAADWAFQAISFNSNGLGIPPSSWEECDHPKDFTPYKALTFWLRGASGGEDAFFYFRDSTGSPCGNNDSTHLRISDYGTVGTYWKKFQVPYADFNFDGAGTDCYADYIDYFMMSVDQWIPAGTHLFYLDNMQWSTKLNAAPVLENFTAAMSPDGDGNVHVTYDGFDEDSDKCRYLTTEYSTNGTTWIAMTPDSSDPVHDAEPLAYTVLGNGIGFVWNSVSDLGIVYDSSSWVRIRVTDTLSNSSFYTTAFVLDSRPLPPDEITSLSITNMNTNGILVLNWINPVNGPGGLTTNALFTDDFEDGNLTEYDLTTASSIDTGNRFTSPNSGDITQNGDLRKNIDTTGYSNLLFVYTVLVNDGGAPNKGRVEYSINGGTDWILVSDYDRTVGTVNNSLQLPSTADNNPNVVIRFSSVDLGAGEHMYVDDISVTGETALPAGDFQGVKIIRKAGSPPVNISDAGAVTVLSNNVTAFTDTGLAPSTTYYYRVFTYNSYPTFSAGVAGNGTTLAAPAGTDSFHIEKVVSSILLKGNSSDPVPGASVTFVVSLSNQKSDQANTVIVSDRLDWDYVEFSTNSGVASAGWTLEWSTNQLPDNAFNSSDYQAVQPTPDRVRWVRIKRAVLSGNSTGVLTYTVIIK